VGKSGTRILEVLGSGTGTFIFQKLQTGVELLKTEKKSLFTHDFKKLDRK